jgi:hypothetical protein
LLNCLLLVLAGIITTMPRAGLYTQSPVEICRSAHVSDWPDHDAQRAGGEYGALPQELLPLFGSTGHHSPPIIGEGGAWSAGITIQLTWYQRWKGLTLRRISRPGAPRPQRWSLRWPGALPSCKIFHRVKALLLFQFHSVLNNWDRRQARARMLRHAVRVNIDTE